MSLYVIIEKEYEDEAKVIYHYGPNQESLEKLEINKETKQVAKIETGVNHPNYYYLKAAAKIFKHNKENPNDMYPKKLVYAS
jgi:hypothetical protein